MSNLYPNSLVIVNEAKLNVNFVRNKALPYYTNYEKITYY